MVVGPKKQLFTRKTAFANILRMFAWANAAEVVVLVVLVTEVYIAQAGHSGNCVSSITCVALCCFCDFIVLCWCLWPGYCPSRRRHAISPEECVRAFHIYLLALLY